VRVGAAKPQIGVRVGEPDEAPAPPVIDSGDNLARFAVPGRPAGRKGGSMPGCRVGGSRMRGGHRNQDEAKPRQQVEINWNSLFLRQRALSPRRFEA
jgi:hypothetical protein